MLPSLVAEYESHLKSEGDISDPYLEKIDTELIKLRKQVEEVRAKLEALSPKLKELEDERSQYIASAVPSMEKPPTARLNLRSLSLIFLFPHFGLCADHEKERNRENHRIVSRLNWGRWKSVFGLI